MPRPTGWRPTAFYRRDGESDAMTGAAQLTESGVPQPEVADVVVGDGILLHGPWVLIRYDDRWGHAEYRRPTGYADPHDHYRLAE